MNFLSPEENAVQAESWLAEIHLDGGVVRKVLIGSSTTHKRLRPSLQSSHSRLKECSGSPAA